MSYKIFDDLSLGVYYTYNKENHTLTFFNRKTPDIPASIRIPYDNNQQYRGAVNKFNTLYIPISLSARDRVRLCNKNAGTGYPCCVGCGTRRMI